MCASGFLKPNDGWIKVVLSELHEERTEDFDS